MNLIEDITTFNRIIEENNLVLAFFWGHHCSVCHSLKPQLTALLSNYFPKVLFVDIQIEKVPELAASYSVFTVPVILLFIEGKEYIREVRIVDLSLLQQKLERIIHLSEKMIE
jgi:thioredoxin-like negative regulator of GroEL